MSIINASIRTDTEKCVRCNSCVSRCLVSANKHFFNKNRELKVDIIDERCIQCGECVKVCTHNARYFVDDTEQFFLDIGKYEIAVVVAPAVLHNFRNYKNLVGWLKHIGIPVVYDISFGADITTWAYLKLYEDNHSRSVISQPCPVIVNYIEHFEPSLLPNLAPVHSPTLCTAIYLRRYKNFNGKIAMISPCIAKESEFNDPNTQDYVSYNVTVSQLKKYLDKNKIDLNNYRALEFDNIHPNLGFTFSRPGGLRENVDFYTNSDLWVKQTEGIAHIVEYLKEYKQRKEMGKPIPQLVDILNCMKGCNCGTATNCDIELDDIDYETNKMKKRFLVERNQDAATSKSNINPLFEMFDNELDPEDFTRFYDDKSLRIRNKGKSYDEVEMMDRTEQIYQTLGKNTYEKRNHNCNACGFHTCSNFVKAVAEGKAMIEICYYYSYMMLRVKFRAIEAALEENLSQTENKLNDIESNQSILNDVAKSINLIAINASIEAASAGTYGMGFTVVASEIKKLADRSKGVITSTSRYNDEIKEQLDILKTSLNKLLREQA